MVEYEDVFKKQLEDYQEDIEKAAEAEYILNSRVFREFIERAEQDIHRLFKTMPDRTEAERYAILNLKKDYNAMCKMIQFFELYMKQAAKAKKKMIGLIDNENRR